ncbi:type I glyceraldehyde-3-phosphate dehydrogenase [Candidatus Woesebacteria bacterium]|nr:type I glyceraldehyde-3-phosphate dehydrogenase [Candidatus Woesebacteria bacterium]
MTKFAINGFGRIGRTALRVWWENFREQADLAVVNTSGSMDIEGWAHLLKYDSNYGVWPHEITVERWQGREEVTDEQPELGLIKIDGRPVLVTAQRDPKKIPWDKYEVAVVIESTGIFTTAEKAKYHIEAGASRVVLSAPAKSDGFETTVLGVENVNQVTGELISNASCTTNCVAPVAQIMHTTFGVEKAMLTTIHAYTDDQNIQDNSHKDLRRARGAAQNIVPTSTGAAKATALVIPELKGIFDGLAVRVPVSTGSLSDLTFITKRDVTVEEVNQAFTDASQQPRWQGKLAVTNDPIVSNDIVGRPESSIVDLSLTQVMGGNMVKVIAWYDNEWGYCNRLVELVSGM